MILSDSRRAESVGIERMAREGFRGGDIGAKTTGAQGSQSGWSSGQGGTSGTKSSLRGAGTDPVDLAGQSNSIYSEGDRKPLSI